MKAMLIRTDAYDMIALVEEGIIENKAYYITEDKFAESLDEFAEFLDADSAQEEADEFLKDAIGWTDDDAYNIMDTDEFLRDISDSEILAEEQMEEPDFVPQDWMGYVGALEDGESRTESEWRDIVITDLAEFKRQYTEELFTKRMEITDYLVNSIIDLIRDDEYVID